MKTKSIDVGSVIKKITELGGHVVLKANENEKSGFEILTPEMAKRLYVLVPLHEDQEGSKVEMITIEQIDLKECDQFGISYGKIDFYVRLDAELLKFILLLKLYSENLSMIDTN